MRHRKQTFEERKKNWANAGNSELADWHTPDGQPPRAPAPPKPPTQKPKRRRRP